jgi:hypothetical protein
MICGQRCLVTSFPVPYLAYSCHRSKRIAKKDAGHVLFEFLFHGEAGLCRLSTNDTLIKKGDRLFPSPAGMSLTKLSLAGNNLSIPGQGEFGK